MHILCAIMKNLTLRIEERTLAKARRIAAERSTSVNALIREYLDELIALESRQDQARRELVELCQRSSARIGDVTWSRESLYDR